MSPLDGRYYLLRDWSLIAAHKRSWWTSMSAADKLRLADGLRAQTIAKAAEWPSEKERDQDLASLIALAALFRRAGDARGT